MARIKRKQINALFAQGKWTGPVTIPTGDSVDVTSLFVGKSALGSAVSLGVLTQEPHNRLLLRSVATGKAITDNGKSVYGRLTFDQDIWTMKFYVQAGGSDVLVDMTGHAAAGSTVSIRFCEVVQFKDLDPLAAVNYGDEIDEVSLMSLSGAGVTPSSCDLVVTSNGQTEFTLDFTPTDPTKVELRVNGVEANYGQEFTVSGNVLTWKNTSYELDTEDELVAKGYI